MKTIFIIAPHFPPSAMPPSQRVRLLVRHLHELDWKAVVITVDHYYREEVADPWMVELAGNQFELVEINCFDQRKTRKFGVGDLGLRMMPYLFSKLLKMARKQKPAFILYPVPPWYIMIIAPLVKWFTGTPYAIDFIDPWVRKPKSENVKAKFSQWLARRFEGFAVKRSAAVFAVSKGILDDLVARYPSIKKKPLVAVPYGVELEDYKSVNGNDIVKTPGKLVIRYIGAISDSMLRVVKVMLQAMKQVHAQKPLQVEFIGTSYAAAGLAKPVVQPFIDELGLHDFVTETPTRVTYRQALELTRAADMLVLVGDMTPYYAASKLMGLIASQQPFLAFVHRESFPAKFLQELNYEYAVNYSGEDGYLPEDRVQALAEKLLHLVNNLPVFNPVSLNDPAFRQHTAWGMTKTFVDTLQNSNT